MSINLSYRRVSQADLNAILEGSPEVTNFWFGDDDNEDDNVSLEFFERLDSDERYLEIHNMWQALHFLLSNEFCFQGGSETEPPLCNVVMGGTPTEIESTYGVVYYLTPDETRKVACFLSDMNREELIQKLDPVKFSEARVYPGYERWDANRLEEVIIAFDDVRDFYQQAAGENQAVLLSSD